MTLIDVLAGLDIPLSFRTRHYVNGILGVYPCSIDLKFLQVSCINLLNETPPPS
jgi:hypothetical protein